MRRRIVRKTAQNRVYLFSGLITCGECGGRMVGRVNTSSELYYYNCNAHYMKRNDCKNKVNLSERKIEAFLLGSIRRDMDKKKIEFEAVPIKDGRDCNAEISVLKSKIEKLKDLYLSDIITLEECKADRELYMGKIAELEREAEGRKKPDFGKIEKLLSSGWETVYKGLKQEQKQEFWRIIIKEIFIYPDRHIEYHFNL